MGDCFDLVRSMRVAAVQVIEAMKPSGVYYGTVTSADPLEITLESSLVKSADELVLTRNVTDYEIEMSVEHLTENETQHTHAVPNAGTAQPTIHRHMYTGQKTFTVHNSLSAGERVILHRQQGGQKYVVIDRIG